jgi:hypothetical protein
MLRWFVAALLTVDRSSKSPSTYTGVLRTDVELAASHSEPQTMLHKVSIPNEDGSSLPARENLTRRFHADCAGRKGFDARDGRFGGSQPDDHGHQEDGQVSVLARSVESLPMCKLISCE